MMTDHRLSDAIEIYIGVGKSAAPTEDFGRLSSVIGPVHAAALKPKLDEILDCVNTLPVDWSAMTLEQSEEFAMTHMQVHYPQLTPAAHKALGRLFTWWWR
jgi:hypothetical protein